ncbi:MAG: hypothetical protein ACFFD4_21000 [Candidatus Odinarchaeota archaeon]
MDTLDKGKETYYLEGGSKDYLIINTGSSTSWYEVRYDADNTDYLVIREFKRNFQIKRIKHIMQSAFYLPWSLVLFAMVPVIIFFEDFLYQFDPLSFLSDCLVALFSIMICVFFIRVMFIEFKFSKLAGDWTQETLHASLRDLHRADPEMLPYYFHLVTIDKNAKRPVFQPRLIIPDSLVMGYRVLRTCLRKRSSLSRSSRSREISTIGFGLRLALMDQHTISIIPGKMFSTREPVYAALEFSLTPLNRSINDKHELPSKNFRVVGARIEKLDKMMYEQLAEIKSRVNGYSFEPTPVSNLKYGFSSQLH